MDIPASHGRRRGFDELFARGERRQTAARPSALPALRTSSSPRRSSPERRTSRRSQSFGSSPSHPRRLARTGSWVTAVYFSSSAVRVGLSVVVPGCPPLSVVVRCCLDHRDAGAGSGGCAGDYMAVSRPMSIVEMVLGSLDEYPLLLTIDEAAGVLRIGRSLAYELARLYERTGRALGLPVHEARFVPPGAPLGARRADCDRPGRASGRRPRSDRGLRSAE